MRTRFRQIGVILALMCVAVFGLLITRPEAQTNTGNKAATAPNKQAAAPSGAGIAATTFQGGQPTTKTYANGVKVVSEVKHDTSPPLRDIPAAPMQPKKEENENELPFLVGSTDIKDPVVQNFFGPLVMPTPTVTFEGVGNPTACGGCLPPDTNGDVGPNHYVQTVNTSFAVWDKSGTVLLTPRAINTLWAGFGAPCQTHNDGDPIVLYDQIADRWFISQFTSSAPYGMCIAVSQGPDPTLSYHRYYFQLSTVDFYDYEKYGVWPDAYYMTANVFEGAGGYHPAAIAYDRAAMLTGSAATFQEFNPGNYYASPLPSDLDGPTLPPAGAPNIFASMSNTIGQLYFWKFHVDWANPGSSSFTGPTIVEAAPFDPNMCGGARQCIPQPSTGVKLDALADRAMYRLAYRNMGDHESLMFNHTVDVDGTDHAGVRWYEFRDLANGPTIYQQGTYAPDAANRWAGSIAMDGDGNIAVGYSVSSSSVFPSIRYSGRLASDPLGQLSQGEATLMAGTGSQTSSSGRWGDYSMITVDPSDDCTFWYTNEYYPTTAAATWKTRIGSFKFPGCGAATTPTPSSTGTPPTATSTSVPTNTPQPIPTACANYSVATSVATILAGTQDLGVHCDDCGVQISLPFPVKLYDQTFTAVNLSSNGVLGFGSSNFAFGNAALPVPVYTYAIAGFWDDLTTNSGGDGVYSTTVGTAPNRALYIEYRAKSLDVSAAPVNFEFVLHEGSANFEVIYGAAVAGNGTTATSGVERDMQYYTQYSFNTPTLLPGTMLSYTIAACPATSTPVATATQPAATSTVPAATATAGSATATPTACTLEFADVLPGNTFYPFIKCLACRNIINGYPCGGTGEPCNPNSDPYFRPSNSVTRGQLSKVVSQSAGFSEPHTGQTFEDVLPGSTFYDYVERLASRGVMGGYPCGVDPSEPCVLPGNLPYFRPSANATRGQLTKIVSNAAGFTDPDPATFTFTDVPAGSTFHVYVERLLINRPGAMNGYPCGSPGEPCDSQSRPYFRPNATLSRGQTSKIVANTFFPNCQTPQR
ncbi:MAG: S-layer homology domain-containing protein [Chloroflexota bacterium]